MSSEMNEQSFHNCNAKKTASDTLAKKEELNWDSQTTPTQNVTAESDVEKADPITKHEKPEVDPNLVTWSGPDDPTNPHNWSTGRKIFITAIWVYGNVVTTIASSIFSSGAGQIEEEFHIGSTVTTLGVSIFVLVRTS